MFGLNQKTIELVSAGIQVIGGASLAVYTYKNAIDDFPFMFSMIAIDGMNNFIKIIRKKPSECRKWSWWNFASGTNTFFTSVYVFSECFQRKEMWVPCLTLAASGYYLITSSIRRLDTVLSRRPLLKCCQLMSEPAVIACAATYLFYFRNHTERWLKCLHFLVTAVTGFKIADRGLMRYADTYHHTLLKAIEMAMGGSFLCISCAALAIYSSASDFYCTSAFTSFWSIYGAAVTFNSLVYFQECVEMERPVFHSICGMIAGPIVFLAACVCVKCMSHPMRLPLFFVMAGTGIGLHAQSVIDLSDLLPLPVCLRYYQRVMGPVMTVYSSLCAAYVGHLMGWRFSLFITPFIVSGIYGTYDGFRRSD